MTTPLRFPCDCEVHSGSLQESPKLQTCIKQSLTARHYGKSTTTSRVQLEWCVILKRELDKLKQEIECLGESSFALLSGFDMDRSL